MCRAGLVSFLEDDIGLATAELARIPSRMREQEGSSWTPPPDTNTLSLGPLASCPDHPARPAPETRRHVSQADGSRKRRGGKGWSECIATSTTAEATSAAAAAAAAEAATASTTDEAAATSAEAASTAAELISATAETTAATQAPSTTSRPASTSAGAAAAATAEALSATVKANLATAEPLQQLLQQLHLLM